MCTLQSVCHLEHKVHAILRLVEKSSANLSVLELNRDYPSLRVVQKDNGHTDAGIARNGHWCSIIGVVLACRVC